MGRRVVGALVGFALGLLEEGKRVGSIVGRGEGMSVEGNMTCDDDGAFDDDDDGGDDDNGNRVGA